MGPYSGKLTPHKLVKKTKCNVRHNIVTKVPMFNQLIFTDNICTGSCNSCEVFHQCKPTTTAVKASESAMNKKTGPVLSMKCKRWVSKYISYGAGALWQKEAFKWRTISIVWQETVQCDSPNWLLPTVEASLRAGVMEDQPKPPGAQESKGWVGPRLSRSVQCAVLCYAMQSSVVYCKNVQFCAG